MTHDHPTHGSDMKAAFTGLIAGAIALLVILTTIVHFTNQHYAAKEPAAESSK